MGWSKSWCVGIKVSELLDAVKIHEDDKASVGVPIEELRAWHKHKSIKRDFNEWLVHMDEGDMDGFLEFTEWRPEIVDVEAW